MRIFFPVVFALSPAAVQAHPHLFIETDLTVVVDEAGYVTGVEVVWTYEFFFSLLLTEDLGIDADGDMRLTPDEMLVLEGAVLNWPPDFQGDTWVTGPDGLVPLGARERHTVEFLEGQIIERHYRPLAAPVSAHEGVMVQVYDQTYYTAYTMTAAAEMRAPDGCEIATVYADLDDAYSTLDELLYGRPADDPSLDTDFPEVGSYFADTVTVTCAGV